MFIFFVFFCILVCLVFGVAQLDFVIIVLFFIEDGVNFFLEYLQFYWEELENLVQSKKIVVIGIFDLDKIQLEQLYQWVQVKDGQITMFLGGSCFLVFVVYY